MWRSQASVALEGPSPFSCGHLLDVQTAGNSAIKSDVKVNGGDIYCLLYVSVRSGLTQTPMCRHHLLKHALRGVPNIRGCSRLRWESGL